MTVLQGVAAVRKRPGMYVGDTEDGSGILHLVFEVLANALDLHLSGKCDCIEIVVDPQGMISVADNGPGLRLELSEGVSFAERALTQLHNTPTLDGHAPHEHLNLAGGLHGVGLCVVCALSSSLQLDVYRDHRHYRQSFARGQVTSTLLDLGVATDTGTRISFLPDPEIFATSAFSSGLDGSGISKRLQELAYLLPGLQFKFLDQRQHVYLANQGLRAMLEQMRVAHWAHLSPWQYPLLAVKRTLDLIEVEIVAGWSGSGYGEIRSYANIHATTGGGTHVNGFLQGLISGLRKSAPALRGLRATPRNFGILKTGLYAIVCVRLRDPRFGAPTKNRLNSQDAKRAVRKCAAQAFAKYLEAAPELLAQLSARFESSEVES